MTIWQGMALGAVLCGIGLIGCAVVVLAIDEVARFMRWFREWVRR